jgi:hypothetical protein
MRTPAGKECRYFYGNYYRGANREECRLLEGVERWTRDLCFTCPVPDILMANACQYMMLTPKVVRKFPFTKRQVEVTTYCSKTNRSGFDPHIGCGECHTVPPEFRDIDDISR